MVTASKYTPFTTLSITTGYFCFSKSGYSFRFNGKELDKEGMGGGGSTYDYGFRIYNAQLGKFLSVDPLTKSYPMLTPYQFASNSPVKFIDLDGLEATPADPPASETTIRIFTYKNVKYTLTFISPTEVEIKGKDKKNIMYESTFKGGVIQPFLSLTLYVDNLKAITNLIKPINVLNDPERVTVEGVTNITILSAFLNSKENTQSGNPIQLKIVGTTSLSPENINNLMDADGKPYKPALDATERKKSWLIERGKIVKDRLFGTGDNPNVTTGAETTDTETQGARLEFILPDDKQGTIKKTKTN